MISKPFLRWAGGKGQLLKEIIPRLPAEMNRYWEPFVGAGAVFFAIQPKVATLIDMNEELMNAFRIVRDAVDPLITALSNDSLFANDKEAYLRIRSWTVDEHELFLRAARLIYLNKTCFNGLYRVNSKGGFNVPYGNPKNPTICDAGTLQLCSQVLIAADVKSGDFSTVLTAEKGDFAYLDPPYIPASETSAFTTYTKGGFGPEDHERLALVCRELDRKGVRFLLSNADVPKVHELYKGFQIDPVSARRNINSKGDRRGRVGELLIRNY